ncbi:hypothetical protein [Streptomyces lycii]|uniref:hypothetical protein n=1 Tax=Streptomyces lycii TaxID=2654337 RepID=UPI0012E21D7E|nr:hypothetical protein [Streptomyces lycii]
MVVKVFDTERQEWSRPEEERLSDPDRALDLRRQRLVRRNTAVVLAAAGLVFGVWALGWGDEPEPYREPVGAASGEPGPGAASEDGPRPETTPGEASALPPPAGWEPVHDPEGFRLALPEGWERESRPSLYGMDVVDYRDRSGVRRLQVFQVMESSPYASLEAAQLESERLDGYELITLEETGDGEREAAVHEYRADEVAGEADTGRRHVIDHRFEAGDGERYALVVYGSAGDGEDDERELLDTALSWFCPDGTTCAAPGN